MKFDCKYIGVFNKLVHSSKEANGSTIYLYINLIAVIVFFYSLSFLTHEMLQGGWFESLFLFITVFLNPFYVLLVIFPLIYIAYRLMPGIVFKTTLFLATGIFFIYLLIDKYVFTLFKFHINSFVLKILSQPDVLRVLGIGTIELLMIFVVVALGVIVAWALFILISISSLNIWFQKTFRGKTRKFGVILLILAIFIMDKTTFAWLLHNKSPSIYLLPNKVPFYITAKMSSYFEDMGYKSPETGKNLPAVNMARNQVNYPLTPYQASKVDKTRLPNIFLLISDALRPDMVDPEIMPNTFQFMKSRALQFDNHYSSSNGTTQGLFSLFYGLPFRYMSFFSKGEISPVMIDALISYDYQFNIFSNMDLGWFGTEEVIFFKIREDVNDNLRSDDKVTTYTIQAIDTHLKNRDKRPLFLMNFYDAPHLAHFKHPDFKKFVPDDTQLIFDPNNKEDRLKGFNEYKNAANYVDHQLGVVLSKIEQEGLFDNSIIIITSDHGSEKYEHGHWGHASAFTNEQLRVPLIVFYPGIEPGTINRMTSHLDISATLLELLGDTYDKKNHTVGKSIFDETHRDYIIADGAANRVLIDGQYKIDYTPFEGISYYKVTDSNDNPVSNEEKDAILAAYSSKIYKMFEDFQKFLR